ncbi:helix-turn-helix domain-containing protein [Galbibacter sp. EGI 63066]|uniref:helix-turn-helix domain-containing protein n=1 Tax=Galbibacter sp. EGI 63066 TaxID=2993559 RepID=UPI002248B631|nr:helix-turn-helix domain-containing protein [Galbibacter sp. EGI 63066]
MDTETQRRLDQVYELLYHISNGNFNYRISRSDHDDELEALITTLNMMTENIQNSFFHQGYIAMHDSYMINNQVLFFVNDKSQVVYINPKGYKLLQYKKNDIVNQSIHKILTTESAQEWDKNFKTIFKRKDQETNLKLTFRAKNELHMPANCTILTFSYNADRPNLILLTFPNIASKWSLVENRLRKRIDKQRRHAISNPKKRTHKQPLSHDDIKKIRQVGEFINHNLSKPIPTLGALAIQYGTNEFKLKQGFKELYGMTVLQYIKNERLRNAHVIAQNTNIPVKQIAQTMGFKKANHFSREFKKRYGYSVSDLRMTTQMSPSKR